jgi:hypothetical protein
MSKGVCALLMVALVTATIRGVERNVVLVNRTWTKVNVEVRRGKESDCGKNAAFETKKLLRGESWSVPAPDTDVCYRRDRDPDHPNGQWTEWHRVTPTGSADTTVELR